MRSDEGVPGVARGTVAPVGRVGESPMGLSILRGEEHYFNCVPMHQSNIMYHSLTSNSVPNLGHISGKQQQPSLLHLMNRMTAQPMVSTVYAAFPAKDIPSSSGGASETGL